MKKKLSIFLFFIKQNVEIVIQEWIETAEELGREIPKPKGKLMFA